MQHLKHELQSGFRAASHLLSAHWEQHSQLVLSLNQLAVLPSMLCIMINQINTNRIRCQMTYISTRYRLQQSCYRNNPVVYFLIFKEKCAAGNVLECPPPHPPCWLEYLQSCITSFVGLEFIMLSRGFRNMSPTSWEIELESNDLCVCVCAKCLCTSYVYTT